MTSTTARASDAVRKMQMDVLESMNVVDKYAIDEDGGQVIGAVGLMRYFVDVATVRWGVVTACGIVIFYFSFVSAPPNPYVYLGYIPVTAIIAVMLYGYYVKAKSVREASVRRVRRAAQQSDTGLDEKPAAAAAGSGSLGVNGPVNRCIRPNLIQATNVLRAQKGPVLNHMTGPRGRSVIVLTEDESGKAMKYRMVDTV